MMGIGLGWLGDSSEEMAKKALDSCWRLFMRSCDNHTAIFNNNGEPWSESLRVCEIVGYRLPQWWNQVKWHVWISIVLAAGWLRLIRLNHCNLNSLNTGIHPKIASTKRDVNCTCQNHKPHHPIDQHVCWVMVGLPCNQESSSILGIRDGFF